MSKLKIASIYDLNKIEEINDIEEFINDLRKIFTSFKFEYKNNIYLFLLHYSEDSKNKIKYIVKINNMKKEFLNYEEALNYLKEKITEKQIEGGIKVSKGDMYELNGFEGREDCVKILAEEFEVSETVVNNVIDKLGENDIDKITTFLEKIKNKESNNVFKKSRLKLAKVKDLGKIDKVDMDEFKKIWGGFKFKYNDISYQFSKVFTDEGPDYEVKIDGEAKILKEFDQAIKYLEKSIKENKKEDKEEDKEVESKKISRLKKVANHVSPMMHEEVNQHITSEPSGSRTKAQQSSMAFVTAKELMAALPLVPANEVLYNLVQDIENGSYDDISSLEESQENWEAWKERTKELLIAKGLLVKTSRLKNK